MLPVGGGGGGGRPYKSDTDVGRPLPVSYDVQDEKPIYLCL